MTIKKIISSFIFLQIVTFSFCQTDSVIVKGILINTFTREPIQNFEIILTSYYGAQLIKTVTDKNGRFEFKTEKKKSFMIELINPEFVEKSIIITDSNRIIDLEFKLRPRKQNLTYLDIDSTIINSKVKAVIKKFSLDLTDIHNIHEPPGVLRGFNFELGDSTIVYIFIDRTSVFRQKERILYNKKIVGLGISRSDGIVRFYGEGKPYIIRLNNKHFIENKLE